MCARLCVFVLCVRVCVCAYACVFVPFCGRLSLCARGAQRAVDIIEKHDPSFGPLYLYLAPQNVHLACGVDKGKQGIQVSEPVSE
jgi:hypothetical protein